MACRNFRRKRPRIVLEISAIFAPAAIVLTQAAGATSPGQIELQGWEESASSGDVLAKSAQNPMQIAKRKVMK
jgi:hypothetical protein